MQNAIRRKLESLIKMTVENGCTEDEADTALAMAAAIAAKAGIDLHTLNPDFKTKIVRKRFTQERPIHQTLAAQAAAILMGVMFEDSGNGMFQFIGRDNLTEAAEDTMFWLFRQIDDFYKSALTKGLSKRERAEFRRTFKAACAQRVRDRAEHVIDEIQRNESKAQAATGRNALTVQGYFRTLKEEIKEFRYGPPPTEEQKAQWRREAEVRAERERAWRADNPEAAAKADREQSRRDKAWQRRWERQQEKRKSRPEIPTGSGTGSGRTAGDAVKLKREVQ